MLLVCVCIAVFSWDSLFERRSIQLFDFSPDGNFTSHYVSNSPHTLQPIYGNTLIDCVQFEMPPTYLSYVGLLGIAILYGALSWYFDAVLKGNHGIPRKL